MEDSTRQKKRLALVRRLKEGIADRTLVDGSYLLPVRALSAATDASPVTVLHALAVLRAEGVITGGRKCRPRIAVAKPGHTAPAVRPRRSWHVARDHIAELVLTSRRGETAALPSAKELAGLLGMSRRNVGVAFEALCDEGLIERHGKRYRTAGQHTTAASLNRVALLAPANEHGQVTLGFLEEDFLHALEMQCAARSLSLETYGFTFTGEGVSFTDPSGRPASVFSDLDSVIGVIQTIIGPEQASGELFRALYHSRKPIALFDAIGGWELPPLMKNAPMIRIFDFSAGKQRARTVARYLLTLGHRGIAYFSPFHGLTWSQQRFAGLDEAFAGAGFPGAVRNYSVTEAGYDGEYQHAVNEYRLHSLQRNISATVESWSRKAPHWYSDAIHRRTRFAAGLGFREGEIERRMEAFFEAAHARARATAWVGANDDTAIMALKYSGRRGIRVPDDLSIIGFDNKLQAFKHGLTSYDFNRDGVIAAMLNFLLRPRSISHLTSRQRVEIPGYIVERKTTARVTDSP